MCTYNGELFLKSQLDSVLKQRYTNIEIVIVDDCSTDKTWEILQEYASSNANIQIFRNDENLGYNKNFEKAVRLCSGEKIAICDQDDIWDENKLSAQYALFGKNQLIYHDSELIDTDGNSMNFKISKKFSFYRGANPEPFLFMNCVSGHSIMVNKSLLNKALPFPNGHHYDQWLAFVAACEGSIDFVDTPLVKYRQHASNSTDLMGYKKSISTKAKSIARMEKETEWLKFCADYSCLRNNNLISQLYALSVKRNASFFQISYGRLIWKNRQTLLPLLRKSSVSKFFFSFRKIWGSKSKMLV